MQAGRTRAHWNPRNRPGNTSFGIKTCRIFCYLQHIHQVVIHTNLNTMRYFFANFYFTLLAVMLAGIVGMAVAAPGPEICMGYVTIHPTHSCCPCREESRREKAISLCVSLPMTNKGRLTNYFSGTGRERGQDANSGQVCVAQGYIVDRTRDLPLADQWLRCTFA